MQRIFASSLVAFCLAACASPLLIRSDAHAESQLVDPGWQLVYTGQSDFGGNGSGGLIQQMFGDGVGQPATQRAYQPAPVYYQQVPPQWPRPNQPAPVYYYRLPAQQPRPYQQPTAPYHATVPTLQPSAYQPPAPQYYAVPAPQLRAYRQPPAQYAAAPAQQPGGYQPAPMYDQPVAAPQPSAYQPAPQPYQPAPAPQQQVAPASYQSAPAPQQGPFEPLFKLFQSTPAPPQRAAWNNPAPSYAPSTQGDMARPAADPKFARQVVDYQGDEKPGTIVIDTPHYFLYLVTGDGKALRYGIGVGRPGFTWAGVKEISAMREWPDWYPPSEMLERRPDLPRYMPGGPDNPLGARALYLGSTLYRIHGSNEPWTIGTQVSSGCIRMRNDDVTDLYDRVKVGTKVIVI